MRDESAHLMERVKKYFKSTPHDLVNIQCIKMQLPSGVDRLGQNMCLKKAGEEISQPG